MSEITSTSTPASGESPPGWRPPAKSIFGVVLFLLLAIAAALTVLWAWQVTPFKTQVEKTENAYIRGRTTILSPQVNGYVVDVSVHDYESVKAGQVLARIDDRIYQARVAQAKASLAAQEANLANSRQARASREAGLTSQSASLASAQAQWLRAKADLSRVNDLVKDGSVSVREQDQTVAALALAETQVRQAAASREIALQEIRTVDVAKEGLQAQVAAARAQLRLAEIDLENTVVRAPEAGQVGEVGVRRGQYVTNGTQLLALVPAERWIIANYKEAQTSRMAPGQAANFTVDALGAVRFSARVERLAPAGGSEFAVIKPDNATGNFVKVPQRIGVRLLIDPEQPFVTNLRPGMSVEVQIDTAKKP